jgi:hypothetical protein
MLLFASKLLPSFNFFLLKAEAPPLRAHVAHSVTPRAFYYHWPASVLSNLLVGWSSFVLRESRAESNRVDLGLAEMGRKAGVIALFDVDGTLTPARKVVAFYATFLSSGFGVVGFPFETIFLLSGEVMWGVDLSVCEIRL